MTPIKRSFDILTNEERSKATKDIISFYENERDEEMDIIGAELLLDMFLQNIAPFVYNKAVDDIRILVKKQSEELDFELGVLKK